MAPVADSLLGRVIAIAESRELDVFSALLERRGAQVLRYPLVAILDAPEPAAVLAWLRGFARGQCDDLILLTGEGLRRLMRCIELHEPTLREPFLRALGAVRTITRGPKPARALRELGRASDYAAVPPTTAGVIELLGGLDCRGRRVGVQLYGEDPNRPLIEFLQAAGATVSTVAPYRYAADATAAAVHELLTRLTAGEIDAIAFTSKAQVERLFALSPAHTVRLALAATQVAAVGPIVAAALAARGVTVGAMPQDAWFMKPLSAALGELLAQR